MFDRWSRLDRAGLWFPSEIRCVWWGGFAVGFGVALCVVVASVVFGFLHF